MATLNYRDPATGDWVAFPVYLGPAGLSGPTGPTGPAAISGAAGNAATLGSDGRLFVPTGGLDPATASALYVDVPGDTMTGDLFVPDQVAAPPVEGRTAITKGYVDQTVTVDLVDPVAPPVRDGLAWFVVEETV